VDRNPKIKIIGQESGRTYVLMISVISPPFDNKALRAAMAYGIDRQVMIDTFFGGNARKAYSIEASGWWNDPTIKVYDYNPQKAREKLIEAGYPDGVTVPFWSSPSSSSLLYAQAIKSMLGEVGITLDIKPFEGSFLRQMAYDNTGNSFHANWWSSRSDPHTRIWAAFHPTGWYNYRIDYDNPEVNKLIDQAAQVYDKAKAKVLYSKIQRIVAEDAPYIYIAHPNVYAVMNKNVNNFKWRPDLIFRLYDIWMEQ